MSRICDICGKKPLVGNNVSHANNKTKKRWFVNLRNVRAVLDSGAVKKLRVCTRCIRSGRIKKAA